MKRILFLLLLAAAAYAEHEPSPIEDHNFLLETGWNRDDAVVQYTTFFLHARDAWASELTQEWAASSPRHQLSYTIPFYTDGETGLGDVTLNYRYQLFGGAGSRMAIAPRVALILPTRDDHFGGAVSGVQVVLPISANLTERLATHTNIGATWSTKTDWGIAQSFVYTGERIAVSLDANYAGEIVIRPGIQFLLNIKELQVAPGFALTRDGVMLSVSLERALR